MDVLFSTTQGKTQLKHTRTKYATARFQFGLSKVFINQMLIIFDKLAHKATILQLQNDLQAAT